MCLKGFYQEEGLLPYHYININSKVERVYGAPCGLELCSMCDDKCMEKHWGGKDWITNVNNEFGNKDGQ